MGASQRLDKIEAILTPRQAIFLWLKEAHAHPHLEDYIKWLSESPIARAPHRFVEQAIDAFEESDNPRETQKRQKITSQAKQDYDFLYSLFMNVNFELLKTAREKVLWVQLLAERLASLKAGPDEIDSEDVLQWKKLFCGFYAETYVESRAFKIINQRYFSGYDLLFHSAALQLGCRERVGKTFCDIFNEFCNGKESFIPIDLAAFEDRLQPHVDQKIRNVTDMAKAEVLVKMGRREDSLELIKKHAFGPTATIDVP